MFAGSEAWDKKYQTGHPRWRGPPAQELDIPDGGRVLELGCGDGKTLRGLVGRNREVVALDFSNVALLSSVRSIKDRDFHLVRGDGAALPFASGTFQLVVGHHFFEHLLAEERRGSAKEAARVLAPGGALRVRAFGRGDMREGKGKMVEPSTYVREGIAYHYFTEEELCALFSDLAVGSIEKEVTIKRFAGEPRERVVLLAEFRKGL